MSTRRSSERSPWLRGVIAVLLIVIAPLVTRSPSTAIDRTSDDAESGSTGATATPRNPR